MKRTNSERNIFCMLIQMLFFLIISSGNFIYPQQLDMEKIHGMNARGIGPAGMSGRVTAIDVVLSDPDIFYVGTASGGLWKTKGGGVAWEPLFDDQPVASIGALAIDQRTPDIIWVGTGEGNPRNSQTSGNGIYKSMDDGKTWKHLGLENTRNIHRIIIDPYNSDVVYAGVQGSAWGEHPERGVYKTTDGGKTWEKILYVNDKTGIADLVIDPANPNKLIAAMWEFRRWPWFFESGGDGSGLFITFDGGKTWVKKTEKDGLPKGKLGRMGLAIGRSNPNIIYALIEAKEFALYKSEDGGFKWKKMTDKNIGNRPFYYAELYVDPINENRVYSLYSNVNISEDGGKTFEPFITWDKGIHPDHHAWWIHPNDPNYMINGNDGGLAVTHDRGKSWRFATNLPLGQYYHIRVDNAVPYNVYGGMQDNGSWRGPSRVLRNSGITNSEWEGVGGGDGFDVMPQPDNARNGYSMSQGGNLMRYDVETGLSVSIKPVHPEGIDLRFNWNAAIAQDPFDPNIIYYGSQFIHKSTNRGNNWEIISPDLTTNDPSKQKQKESGGLTFDVTNAENFTTIIAISPSPLKQGVIWVGTDDGNVQLTTDGGITWTNVVKNIKGIPEGTWVPHIHAANYNSGEAFVVFDDHRRNNWTPYIYHTIDYGKSWKRLADEKKVFGYALSIVQDPVERNLLFLGTEFGLYISFDSGNKWTKWAKGYLTVSTIDMVIHPRENDLVIGTFGRSAYILDNIQPLRELTSQGMGLLNKPLHLFKIPDAILEVRKGNPPGMNSTGNGEFMGENRPFGAMITYVINPDTTKKKLIGDVKTNNKIVSDSVKIEIVDSDGKVIRTLESSPKAGINRFYWTLNRKGVRFPGQPKPKPDSKEPDGFRVSPGRYMVRIIYKDHSDSAFVNVNADHRLNVDITALRNNEKLYDHFQKRVETATNIADRLREAKESIEVINGKIKEREEEPFKELKKKTKTVQDSLQVMLEMINGKEYKGLRSDDKSLNAKLSSARRYLSSYYEVPLQMYEISLKEAESKLKNLVKIVNSFFDKEWKDYRTEVDKAGVSFFNNYDPIIVD